MFSAFALSALIPQLLLDNLKANRALMEMEAAHAQIHAERLEALRQQDAIVYNPPAVGACMDPLE